MAGIALATPVRTARVPWAIAIAAVAFAPPAASQPPTPPAFPSSEQLRQEFESECGDTSIAELHIELDAGGDRGLVVTFANGLTLYGEDLNPVAERQRRGDRVRACLVFIPASCPLNDKRGRVYEIFDHRLELAYTLVNSRQPCDSIAD